MCVLERGCPSRGSCACPALPPAHPAQNTAGLKPDLPTVWPAQSSRLPDAWLCPHHHALGALPTTQDRVQRRPQCQDGQARESQSLGLRAWACTLPPALGQPHCLPELPRGTGPRPAFSRHPALPGPRLWPSPRHPGPMSLYLSSMMPRASVSWTRPLLAADQLPERAGAYPGPLLSPQPS